jgi:sugar transferase (PEP-CTERM/EpsH1 system associated)
MRPTPETEPHLVVHVVHAFSTGGLENGVVNLINRLPADRWRHAVLALTGVSMDFCSRVERSDVEYLALHKGPGHLLRLYPWLFRFFRERRPAIVHTRNLAALEAQVPACIAGVPARVHGEHGWDLSDPAGKSGRYRLVRLAYRPFVHRYVALSRHIESYLERSVGVPHARIAHICNGVDTARFRPPPSGREAIPGSPFSDSGLWIVGTVGRMQAIKNQTKLAEAFVRVLRLDPRARKRMRLVMIGDGPLREEVTGLLERAGVRDLAWLPGERADVPQIMRGLDCFALPSLAEGISNTILEAMASGLPVVATDVGGNPDLVENGLTGRLVPSAGANGLAEALLAYFRDPALARRHGRAGRNRTERQFSLERMAADYERLYLNLLQRPAGAATRLGAA